MLCRVQIIHITTITLLLSSYHYEYGIITKYTHNIDNIIYQPCFTVRKMITNKTENIDNELTVEWSTGLI